MKPEYILLIVAGGVFVFMLLIYIVIAYERRKKIKSLAESITKSYSEGAVKKMEYDVAFYGNEAYNFFFDNGSDRQVTIDDLLNSSGVDEKQIVESAIFSQVEDESTEEIVGKYNPDSAQ